MCITLYTKVEKLPGVLERSHFLSDSEEKIKKNIGGNIDLKDDIILTANLFY